MRGKHGFCAAVCAAALLSWAASADAVVWEFTTIMNAGQEVPSPIGVPPQAIGVASVEYDDVSNDLSWSIMWQNLSSEVTAGHFHAPAGPGVNAPAVQTFTGAAAPTAAAFGTANILWGADLFAGDVYLNLHTILNPPGEIRGQLGLAGTSATSPIFPDNFDFQPGTFRGHWVFNERTGEGAWFDPWTATGFLYETSDGSNFETVQWLASFGDLTVTDATGSTLVPGGDLHTFAPAVNWFTITGISPAVDGENPAAFPTFLSFDQQTVSFVMTPIPEPSTLALACLGIAGFSLTRRRKRPAA